MVDWSLSGDVMGLLAEYYCGFRLRNRPGGSLVD